MNRMHSPYPGMSGQPGRWLLDVSRLLLLFVCLLAGSAHGAEQRQDSGELVAFVDRAVALIEKKGETSFGRFRVADSEWFRGDLYIFVWGLDGMRYVYPPDPSGEGNNMRLLRDVSNKPIGEMFIATAAEGEGRGWVHYQWPRPGGIFPAWKSTYIRRATAPSGESYLVGAGLYNMRMEQPFLIALVESAARLLAREGRTAFDRLKDSAGEYMFMDTYVFVIGRDGTELVNPAFPSLEGRKLLDYRDAAGKLLVREMIQRTQDGRTAWVTYRWPRPGQSDPAEKQAYVMRVRVDGEEMIVGAGMYEE